jgi:hypothetical protein
MVLAYGHHAELATDWNSKLSQRFWGWIPKVFPNDSKGFQSFPMISNHFFKKIMKTGTCVRPPCDVWRSASVELRRDRGGLPSTACPAFED